MSCQCAAQGCCTPDPKEVKLGEVLAHYKAQKGALIPVLQEAQEIYGYLPAEVLRRISLELKIPLSKVYGVVTFYAQFRLKPMGRNIVRVCLGTACHVRGGAKILETVEKELGIVDGETTDDLRYTIETIACIGACALAPVMMINDDTHGRLTPGKIRDILAQYK